MALTAPLRRAVTTASRIAQVTFLRLNSVLPPGKTPEIDAPDVRALAGRIAVVGPVRAKDVVELPADRPPWHDTGIDLAAGESVTWLAGGRVYLSGMLDIFVGPNFQLWARVGDSPIRSGTRATNTLRAERAGRLYLASYFPGEWSDESGALATPVEAYRGLGGGLTVLLLRWNGDPLEGLVSVASAVRHSLVDLEIDRLTNAVRPPEGWRHLWFLGHSEIYSSRSGGSEIHCQTRCDVGILQKDVDLPFTPGTRLAWSWKVDAIPSTLAEDTLPTHDYLSIAVEFSNGIDITYYWSARIAPGTGYWCPLPTWARREYHIAARSGVADLGRWTDEDKDLHADYAAHIGPPPERIRRVWLISNSLFQRGRGECTYRAIRIRDRAGTEAKVL